MPGDKRKRGYGVACLPCREKKISCDGRRPKCGGCQGSEEECQIPTSARPLRRLQLAASQTPGSSQGGGSEDVALSGVVHARLALVENKLKHIEQFLDLESDFNPSDSTSPQQTSQHLAPFSDTDGVGTSTTATKEYDGAKYQLTVDGTGNVIYHGLTGWSQGPNIASEARPTATADPSMADPAFAPIFQALATSKHISVAPKLGDALLEAYFCYQVFNIVERSTFMRDMALGGAMFSDFLLMCMYASATRMIDGLTMEERDTQGALFGRLAKEYLAKELDGPTRIPTIQGLLLLAGRECPMGDVSQGWNHTGLAFRMIQDLGIHLAPEKVAGVSSLSYEEQAHRDRIFWSAFIWDKSISLALGREPTFSPRVGRDPCHMVDFDDDQAPWTAYFSDPSNCPEALAHYVCQPTWRVASFRFMAQICIVLHDIIIELYSTESRLKPRQRMGFISKTRQRLDLIWDGLPSQVRLDGGRHQPVPPWIFTSLMLYRASNILLYRLILDLADISGANGHVGTCLEHSTAALQMAVSFTQTFGERMSYVAMYSSFVAASFDILLLESSQGDLQLAALTRLQQWLGIMEKSVVRVPSIRRSVHHISVSTWNIISKQPMLATSEPGQRIAGTQEAPVITPEATSNGLGTGVASFDFFELFNPLENMHVEM